MIQRIREKMREEGIDCLIVTQEENFTWAIGKRITGYMFLTQGRKEFVIPRFYRYETQDIDAEYVFSKQDYEEALEEKAERFAGEVRVDENSEKLEELFEAEETGILEDLRQIKTEEEVEKIRKACEITDEAQEYIGKKLFSGIDEFEAVAEINSFYSEKGVEDSFLTNGGQSLVQRNSLEPHRPPEKKEIKSDDLVIVDSGCRFENYCSDITRTYCENPSREQEQLFDDVKEIQEKIIEMIESGGEVSDLAEERDRMAEEMGYNLEENVLYTLGHGVGVEVHEGPGLSVSAEEVELEEGMVVTIEPGLHVPGIGGVRLEDVVLVTEDGCEVLSQSPKEL
ncbi:MAG: M24 family metallopeptidase [Candidatus Nanohalobium sp.]